jgi:hypothetical protein
MVHETFAAHLVNLREKLAEDRTGSRQLVPVQYFAHFHTWISFQIFQVSASLESKGMAGHVCALWD